MSRLRLPLFVVGFWISSLCAHAQSVRWEPARGTLAFGQTSELQLVFENCSPKGDPVVPAVPGLTLQRVGQSSQTSIINGTVTRSETLTYAARPTQRSAVTVPEFSVETDKGRLTVANASYDVGDATVGQSAVPLDNVANSRIAAAQDVWAGEVFPLTYTLNVGRRYFYSVGSNFPEWNPAPLTMEDWSKPEVAESVINGDNRVVVSYATRALARTPGKISLNPATQLVNITTGSSGLGFFPRPNLEQYAITSNRPAINVRPLPANPPADFNGAVGQFTLKSNVVPATATVGEPVTWTLTLNGTGNWPDIPGLPGRQVSKDFRTVQPQAKRTPKEGTLFDASLVEDVVLIPSKPGTYTLGPITWSYFDPARGTYQTITTEKAQVSVTAPAEPPPAARTPLPANTATVRREAEKSPPSAGPSPLPGDPVPLDGASITPPWSRNVVIAALVSPAIALLGFWLWLALRRARQTDPLRERRAARSRISTTLRALGARPAREEQLSLLQSWQRDAAILWELPLATPSATNFPPTEERWTKLWREADRTLYGPDVPLPTDWVSRAEAALDVQPVEKFSALQLFRLSNLFPFAAALALFLVLPAVAVRAAEGKPAYDRGDFATAEKAWREAAAKSPTAWAARHNLSLSLAQQDRWGEAAAQAAAAFAQQPFSEAAHRNLTLTTERAGFAPSVFGGFSRSHPPHVLARQLTPAQWQVALTLSAWLAAFGAGLLLLRAYGSGFSWLKPAAFSLFAFGAVAASASVFSLRVYSPVNDARAVIVWRTTTLRSIPTEADTTQKTSALPAGTVAIIDKSFIGDRWARLRFADGQTGWVRPNEVVALWK